MFYKRDNILQKKWQKSPDFEIGRQILHHKISTITCDNKLFLSCVKKFDLIINLGSGYGIWSINLAKDIKSGAIINIDNYEFDIHETLKRIEENNINFDEQEVNIIFKNIDLKKDPICFKNNSIDFIYQRDLLSVYNMDEWNNIIKEIHRVLNNYGCIELVEYDPNIKHNINNKNNKFSEIINTYLINTLKNNKYIHNPFFIKDIMEKYFNKNDIIIKKEVLPLYYNDKFKDYCINVLILSYLYFEKEIEKYIGYNFETFIEQLKKEWNDNKSYIELYIIYAKKV